MRYLSSCLDQRVWFGLIILLFPVFLVSFVLAPKRPFTRPHPLFWRMVFATSVVYVIALLLVLVQEFEALEAVIYCVHPDLRGTHYVPKEEVTWCGTYSWDSFTKVWNLEIPAHFFGNIVKAMLVRNYYFAWTISVTWELTERCFSKHMFPFLTECWWDSLILDIFLSNGIGIYVGMNICQLLHLTLYEWNSIFDTFATIEEDSSVSNHRWSWSGVCAAVKRFCFVAMVLIFFQIAELNTYAMKPSLFVSFIDQIVFVRLVAISLISAVGVAQAHSYLCDSNCKSFGLQSKILCSILILELTVSLKFRPAHLPQLDTPALYIWLLCIGFMTLLCTLATSYRGKSIPAYTHI